MVLLDLFFGGGIYPFLPILLSTHSFNLEEEDLMLLFLLLAGFISNHSLDSILLCSGAAVDMFGRQAECLLRAFIWLVKTSPCRVLFLLLCFCGSSGCFAPVSWLSYFGLLFRLLRTFAPVSWLSVYCLLTPVILRRRTLIDDATLVEQSCVGLFRMRLLVESSC